MTLLEHAREVLKAPITHIFLALFVQTMALDLVLHFYGLYALPPLINIMGLGAMGITLLARHASHRLRLHDRLAVSLRSVNDTLERRLAEEVTQDGLTGLANRRRFLLSLDELLAEGPEGIYAIYFIDIDHFKLVNDGLGHGLGDRALVAIADRIERAVNRESILGRVGGDEFALALAVENTAEAEAIASRMLSALSNPLSIGNRLVYAGASIGIRYCERERENATALLRDAHTAMHRAKVAGRGCFVFFHAQMQTEIQQRFTLHTDLRQAIEDDQFFVEYQPIFSLLDGHPNGYEALVRWSHPQRGRIEPALFIPEAEDSGLVVSIGAAVLREVCLEVKKRGLTRQTPVGVNLSARQLEQPNLVELVKSAIKDSGIDPACILLEVTESVLMENIENAKKLLLDLKKIGVLIAIDDFGTGYSSLSYLRELPFDVLKIDRSFIRRIDEEASSRDIVRMLVTLAESLHMTVVAEGIETPEQLMWVRNCGCLKAQGFLFARPMPADAAFAVKAMPAAIAV